MAFTIDYPYSIHFLNNFWSAESTREPSDSLNNLRDGLADYPELLKSLHGAEIDIFGPINCQNSNRLIFCLNSERIEFVEIVEKMSSLLGVFQPQSFKQLCELSRAGLAQVFKQLAIHPSAMVSKSELEEFCLLLNRFEDLRACDIPRNREEQLYLKHIRERYFTALAVYHVICHGEINSRAEFATKFHSVANHQQQKRVAELRKLQEYISAVTTISA